MSDLLAGRTIAVPETRELDLLVQMLERHGARAIRCPMVAILDAPDAAPVEAWLHRFIEGGCDDLVLFTGEGLRRLLGFAERAGMRDDFVAALGRVRRITRGPKPVRALREIGLAPDLAAESPTTDGIIAVLAKQDLSGRTVGVQLYGTETNEKLMDFLRQAGARADPVAPYVYAAESEDVRVVDLIRRMADGAVNVIAFTSGPQVRRLWEVAQKSQLEAELKKGFRQTKVAAIGPIAAEELRKLGVDPEIMPPQTFSLKPMINEIIAAVGEARPAS